MCRIVQASLSGTMVVRWQLSRTETPLTPRRVDGASKATAIVLKAKQ